jgi:hypothetical protein
VATTSAKLPTPEEQITELHAMMDKLVASLATVQGNQGRLTVVVNHL